MSDTAGQITFDDFLKVDIRVTLDFPDGEVVLIEPSLPVPNGGRMF